MNFVDEHFYDNEIIVITRYQQDETSNSDFVNFLLSQYPRLGIFTSIDAINTSFLMTVAIFDENSANSMEISWMRRCFPKTFIVVYQPSAATDPQFRLQCFDAGANMVAHDVESLLYTLNTAVIGAGSRGGKYSCPYCDFKLLTEDELWCHLPAYHINCPNETKRVMCPICQHLTDMPLQVHIHDTHGPIVRNNGIANNACRLYSFSLVVCRNPVTGMFLLCQEFANQGFWLPGGAVDAQESLTEAACRETIEEAGVEVELKGILSIEHSSGKSKSTNENIVRMRVIFYAEPVNINQLPKSSPDFESAGASWCSAEQINDGLRLRGKEPKIWSKYLLGGGTIYPMSLLVER